MVSFKKWVLIGMVLVFFAGFVGCEKDNAAEKAGKKIDKTIKGLNKKLND